MQGAIDSNCPLVKTFRTSSDAVDCTATDGSSTVQFHLQFKIDTDAPAVTTAAPDRAPDAGGWYSHPVTVTFSGNDTTSGIAGCTTATYSGPDSGSASVGGTCRDNAGNVSSTASFGLRYDTTAPTVTATALARGPTRTAGTRTRSASRSAARDDGVGRQLVHRAGLLRRAGQREGDAHRRLRRRCRQPRLGLGEPPVRLDAAEAGGRRRLGRLAQRHADAGSAPSDTASCRSRARPGRGKQRHPVVYRGRASRFRDTQLQPGVTYRYQLAATDAAGNTSDVAVAALVPALYLPAAGARVKAGDLLAWAPVKGASYYNVQIYPRLRTRC